MFEINLQITGFFKNKKQVFKNEKQILKIKGKFSKIRSKFAKIKNTLYHCIFSKYLLNFFTLVY